MVLLFFSVAFYAYGVQETPEYLLLMTASVLINWLLSGWIASFRRGRKFLLFLGLLWDFGCLFVFKYADFFIQNINRFAKKEIPLTNFVLPLGIS